MFQPRTVKTLGALFVAMTLGAFALMAMDVEPIHAPDTFLAAMKTPEQKPLAGVVAELADGMHLQPLQWNRIVIHTSNEPRELRNGCHFLIDMDSSGAATINTTDYWRYQQVGKHVPPGAHDYNSDSIGIYLNGNFARQAPTEQQLGALVQLVQELRRSLHISRPDILFYGDDIDHHCDSPGNCFPRQKFYDSLLSPS